MLIFVWFFSLPIALSYNLDTWPSNFISSNSFSFPSRFKTLICNFNVMVFYAGSQIWQGFDYGRTLINAQVKNTFALAYNKIRQPFVPNRD